MDSFDPDSEQCKARLVQLHRYAQVGKCVNGVTHDINNLLGAAMAYAESIGARRSEYEIQMLYGVRPQYQLDLRRTGQRVLIAAPYGPQWYMYLMRRLAERPANLIWFASNMVKR